MATLSRMEYICSLPADVRRRKTCVMLNILASDSCSEDGHWSFCTHDGKVALQSVQCLECGGYTMTATENVYLNISYRALCCCDGFMEEYLEIVSRFLEWQREDLRLQQLEEETEYEDNYDIDDYNDY